jgi:hypothetical protein
MDQKKITSGDEIFSHNSLTVLNSSETGIETQNLIGIRMYIMLLCIFSS